MASYDAGVASNICQAPVYQVMHRIPSRRLWYYVASYDVTSNVYLPLSAGAAGGVAARAAPGVPPADERPGQGGS
jgi:hypothetical protein